MANYRTNTAELTSIADAIRAKTGGTSSLVYPTGFVSAIEGISTSGSSTPYNWLGENATLIDTVYEHTYKLSDTSFDAETVTTSNATIMAATDLTKRYLLASYDYMLVTLSIMDYQYTTTVTDSAHILEGYWCNVYPFGRKPYSTSNFENDTVTYVSSGMSYTGVNMLYRASSNVLGWTANTYGLLIAVNPPGLSNQLQDTFSVTLKTPLIRVNYNNNYMTQAAFRALDTENTTIYIRQELYQCDQNTTWHGANSKTVELYKQKHNIT